VKKLVLTALLLAAIWFLRNQFEPPESAPGAFLDSEPSQGFAWPLPFKREGFTIYPVASFQVDAKVLSRRSYQDGDFESRLSPVDLALGWGPVAEDRVANRLEVTQSGRFY
jgi:hypothetical protein